MRSRRGTLCVAVCVAVCDAVVAVWCCSVVLQCVAVCCSVDTLSSYRQRRAHSRRGTVYAVVRVALCAAMCITVSCSVLQCVIAVCYSQLQSIAVCGIVLQCVAVCCSVNTLSPHGSRRRAHLRRWPFLFIRPVGTTAHNSGPYFQQRVLLKGHQMAAERIVARSTPIVVIMAQIARVEIQAARVAT